MRCARWHVRSFLSSATRTAMPVRSRMSCPPRWRRLPFARSGPVLSRPSKSRCESIRRTDNRENERQVIVDQAADAPLARCPFKFDHESEQHASNWPAEFRQMREECPVAWSEEHGGYWVATRYKDVVRMAQDGAT